MSREQLHASGEHGSAELAQEAAKRSAELQRQPEFSEVDKQKKLEQIAHKEALEAAQESKEHESKKEKPQASEPEAPVSKNQREQSFSRTMTQIQSELPTSERLFSKIIHNPTIEKVSDVVGSTIARPDSILTGSTVAFISVLALYLIAQYAGFSLSGFETIGAFIIGWLLGIAFDIVRGLFKK